MSFIEIITKEFPNIWVTADSHFGHKNILSLEPERGNRFSTVSESDEYIISMWNGNITKNDTVLHLGDFSLTNLVNTQEVINRLNFGKLMLLEGNHDKSRSNTYWLNSGITHIIKNPFLVSNIMFSHKKIDDTTLSNLGILNIFGHMHGKGKLEEGCVSVECTDFKPVWLPDIIKILSGNRRYK